MDKMDRSVEAQPDYPADTIIGQAAGAWKPSGGFGKECILKDVWAETTQRLEHEFRDETEESVQRPTNHLLTTSRCWFICFNDQADHTASIFVNWKKLLFPKPSGPVFKKTPATGHVPSRFGLLASVSEGRGDSLGRQRIHSHGPGNGNVWHERQRSGIVLKKVGAPLFSVCNPSTILTHVAKVLDRMHTSVWIHPDASSANLYLYKERGLLDDLEYAKQRGTDARHEMRTGTLDYMAVEVALGEYLFTQGSKEWYDLRMQRRQKGLPLEDPSFPSTFSHNALHDLESLWWVCVWELLSCQDTSWDQMTAEGIQGCRDTMHLLFPGSTKINHRLTFLNTPAVFFRTLHWIPKEYDVFIQDLDILRACLYTLYEDFDRSLDYRKLNGVHEEFLDIFKDWSRLAREKTIQHEPYGTL